MQINQVNISYLPVEDRLLMCINTLDGAEFRFCFTRAVVSSMLTGLAHSEHRLVPSDVPPMLNPSAREAVEQFQREASIAQADFKTKFAANASSFPLGEKSLLVTKLEIRIVGDQAALAFTLLTNQVVTINLKPLLVASVNKLLCDVVRGIDWNLPFFSIKRPIIRMNESETLH